MTLNTHLKLQLICPEKALPSPLINLANIFNAEKKTICVENGTKRSVVFDLINFSGTGFSDLSASIPSAEASH